MGMLYTDDKQIQAQLQNAQRLTQKLNNLDRIDTKQINAVMQQILGDTPQNMRVNPPFYCSYGTHIHLGKNFFSNFNCTMLDVASITFGDNCLVGPNVAIYTAGHPIHPATRNTDFEYGQPVKIGDNVWLGGNVVICPGITIGSNTVIGAGSVVTHDIPAWSVAVGSPCRVIRKITEADRNKVAGQQTADNTAWQSMQQIWNNHPDDPAFPSAPLKD